MKRAQKVIELGFLLAVAALWLALPFIGARQILPGMLQGRPDGVLPPAPGYQLIPLTTANGIPIVAEFAPAETGDGHPLPHPENQPTLLYFYGAKHILASPGTQSQIRYFREMGVNVLMPDFPGYGMSGGSPSESNFSAAADAAYDYLRAHPGANDRILIGGSSLGSGSAVDLAGRRPSSGLITMGAFTSVRDMGYYTLPRVPRWLVRHFLSRVQFDNAAKIHAVTCPILIVHGTVDRTVPFTMAGELAANAPAPVTRLSVAGAGHDDIGKVGGAKLWTSIRDWLAAPGPREAP
jgi:pimeloyl-ACP methyl ester carboxylesterase